MCAEHVQRVLKTQLFFFCCKNRKLQTKKTKQKKQNNKITDWRAEKGFLFFVFCVWMCVFCCVRYKKCTHKKQKTKNKTKICENKGNSIICQLHPKTKLCACFIFNFCLRFTLICFFCFWFQIKTRTKMAVNQTNKFFTMKKTNKK